MKRFLEEARKMIRINSVSANGNEEIANYVAALMQDRGLKTQVQHVMHSNEDFSKRQFNVIGILGDPLVDRKIKKGILLVTHLDTVSPGILENWNETAGDPFSATLKNGKVYGLGSADAKLDFLSKLHVVEKFREKKLKQPIYLVATCGEEIGMLGAKYLIKSLALNPQCSVVGQPTDLKVVFAHKSLSLYRVSIRYQLIEKDARGFNRRIDLHSFGRSAHSAYPQFGTNAILAAVDFLHRALDHGFEMRFTQVGGGENVNKVPDHALTQFYLTSHQFEDFKRFFREVVKQDGREKAFRVELGGVGDMGVRFLPDPLFPCLTHVVELFNQLGAQLSQQSNAEFDVPHSTVNFGKLIQKSDRMDLFFDFRLLPEIAEEQVGKMIQDGIQTIVARYPSLNISISKERHNPALMMPPEDRFVRVCRKAMELSGISPQFSKESASTEAAQFFQAGYPSIVFGPGTMGGNSHSPNEGIELEQVEKAMAFYERLIEEICL